MLKVTVAVVSVLFLFGCKTKEEVLAAAEEKGKLVAEKKSRLVKGLGEGLQGEGKKASEALTKGVAKVVRGGVKGAVEGANDMPIETSEALKKAGFTAERAAMVNAAAEAKDKKRGIKVYVVTKEPYKGDLLLLLKSGEGKEVGRSKVAFDEKEATGKYVLFKYDEMVDFSVAESVLLQ